MPNATLPGRGGRSLPELLVAVVISGILLALLSSAFIGHQRLVSGTTAMAELRGQQRQAHHIVPAVVREAAMASGDFYAVHDTLIDLAYPIATGITCLPGTATDVTLAPDSSALGQRFASWTHTPQPGDAAHIFDPGALPGPQDDRWWSAAVAGIGAMPNGCSGSPLLDSIADLPHVARHLSLGAWRSPGPPASIAEGALVQFTRRSRLELYASARGDHLGFSDYDATRGAWSAVQPVSGPYAWRGAAGIQFALFDSLGGRVPAGASSASGAALALVVRSRTAAPLRVTGMASAPRAESLAAYVALRNR